MILLSGCVGENKKENNKQEMNNTADKIEIEEYSTINMKSSTKSSENYKNYVRNISKSSEEIRLILGSYAPASNFNMKINRVYKDSRQLYVEGKINKTSKVGATVITNLEKEVVVTGKNLDRIDEIILDVENGIKEDKISIDIR